MSVNTDSMIRNILDRVSRIGYVKPEDIPNIDLYMDQVTTFYGMHSLLIPNAMKMTRFLQRP